MYALAWRGTGVAQRPPAPACAPPSMSEDAIRAIAAEVLGYLTRHPDAADTAEGIQRWWLIEGGVYAPSDVEHALERLARDGAVVRRGLPDGRVLYAAAP
jgi:hypothetical protein